MKSQKVIRDIIEAANIESTDTVLEVGPGTGILTEELVKRAERVIAVEKDKRLVAYLRKKFASQKKLEIIEGDILETKFSIFNFQFSNKSQAQKFKIVANIPYYITSRFLRNFLQSDFQPSLMVLMLQKEVAKRIACPVLRGNYKESLLSISVKAYGKPKIIKIVPASCFHPKPKVDSAILRIDNISKKFFKNIEEARFFSLIKKGFSSRRKLLKNNLKLLDTECLTKSLIKCGISEKARAEDLSPEKWKCLCKHLYKLI